MAFALLFIGILLIVSSVRDTHEALIALVQGDFTGAGNFFYWVIALIAIGIIGYIPKAKPVSDGLLVLILLALILKVGQGGIFTELTKELGTTTASTS